jgi:chloramphenicol O-acetyltransferase type A
MVMSMGGSRLNLVDDLGMSSASLAPPLPPHYLDLNSWPRRDAFEYFRSFDKPYFNICTRLDVARLKLAVKACGVGTLTLAYHYLALRLSNEHEPFRYRLEGGRVRIYDVIHGGTTVLRDDDSFGFAYLHHAANYPAFCAQAGAAIEAAKVRQAGFEPRVEMTDVVHFTTLPWLHFSSFSHARNWKREDAVPKISFGRIDRDAQAEGPRLWLPLSVEVHHALMDGLHVGRYVQAFEAALLAPDAWLA